MISINKTGQKITTKIKSKTTGPKKKFYAFNQSRVNNKPVNKSCATNFIA